MSDSIKRYELRTAMVFFTQSILHGHDGVGPLALSGDMKNFLSKYSDAIADIIADTFSKYAIPDLLRLNGYDPEGMKLEHTPAGEVDISKVTAGLQSAFNMLTWDAADEAWLRSMMGLPEREIDDIQSGRDMKETEKKDAEQKAIDDAAMDEDEMTADLFRAKSPDDYKRRQMERKLEAAITKHLAATKRRVIKEAQAMRK